MTPFKRIQTRDVDLDRVQGHIVEFVQTLPTDIASLQAIGEYYTSSPSGSVTPGATTVFVAVASVNLPAGTWDVSGVIAFAPSTGGGLNVAGNTFMSSSISLVRTSADSSSDGFLQGPFLTTACDTYLPVPTRRIVLTSAKTAVYLVARLDYTTLNSAKWKTDSRIRATRAAP